ncbi:MAG: type II toxin-antitoxin system PemK/MazF family toxin [Desulfuromonadaceae bacterium]|nr:type II toxin-antitoxin system PemK/MazF family toxin [Desulfuromonadaceae bacterium]MDD2855384.1 type II toxin-antitoxin system PemK/MazF family toxin [Desulfuromonadaceae bacterium]
MSFKWSVFMADLNPVVGSEQQGRRPVLVVSNEITNTVMPVVSILPLTSLKKGRRVYPNETLLKKGIAGLDSDSVVLAHQIRTISKQRLMSCLGEISDSALQSSINDALRVHLNL